MRAKSFSDFYTPRYNQYYQQYSAEEQARNPGKVAKPSTSAAARKQKALANLIALRAANGKDLYADVSRPTDPNSEADLLRGKIGYKDPLQSSIESLRKARASQLAKSGELDKYVAQHAAHGVDPFKVGAVEDSAMQAALDKKKASFKGDPAKKADYIASVTPQSKAPAEQAPQKPKKKKGKPGFGLHSLGDAVKKVGQLDVAGIQGALNVADTPFRTAASALTEVSQASPGIGNITGIGPEVGRSSNASLKDFFEQAYHPSQRVSGSEQVQSALQRNPVKDVRKLSNNRAVRGTLGFGTEVAEDPLSYVGAETPGSAREMATRILEASKTSAAQKAAAIAARKGYKVIGADGRIVAGKAGAKRSIAESDLLGKYATHPDVKSIIASGDTAAAKARRLNIAGLTDQEMEQFLPGARRGLEALGVHVPGTGGKVAHGISKTVREIMAGAGDLRDKNLGFLIPHAGRRAVERGGAATTEDAHLAANAIMAGVERDTAKNLAAHQSTLWKQSWEKATKGIKNTEDLMPALEGDKAAVARVGEEHVTAARAVLDSIVQEAQKNGVPIHSIEDYVPHIINSDPKAREAFDALGLNFGSNPRAAVKSFAEKARTLRPGKNLEFLGEKFDAKNNAEITRHLYDIIRTKLKAAGHPELADEFTGFFSPDIHSVMNSYINSISHRMQMTAASQRLAAMGVGAKIHETVNVPADAKLARKIKAMFAQGADKETMAREKLSHVVEDLDSRLGYEGGNAADVAPMAHAAVDQAEAAVAKGKGEYEAVAKEAKGVIATADAAADHARAVGASLEAKHAKLTAQAEDHARKLDDINAREKALIERGKQIGMKPKREQLQQFAKARYGQKRAIEKVQHQLDEVATARQTWLDQIEQIAKPETDLSERMDGAWSRSIAAQDQLDNAQAKLARSEAEAEQEYQALTDRYRAVVEAAGNGTIAEKDQIAVSNWIDATEKQLGYQKMLQGEEDPTLRHVLALSEQAESLRAQIAAGHKAQEVALDEYANLDRKDIQILRDQFKGQAAKLYKNTADDIKTPKDVADWLTESEQVDWDRFPNLLRKVIGWQKAYQISTPGFHTRNWLGGMFNNALAGVKWNSYREFFAAQRDEKAWLKAGHSVLEDGTPENVKRLQEIRNFVGHGIFGDTFGRINSPEGGRFFRRREGDEFLARDVVLPTRHNVWVRLNRAGGEKVEFNLRGTLAWDRLSKGHSIEDAIQDINKYHFDYEDLSPAEQYLTMAIPFYTWTRKNVPLQMEMFVRNPKVYARYDHLKDSIEAQSTPDQNLPDFTQDRMLIRTPLQRAGGHVYLSPDLPLKDVGELQSPLAIFDTSAPLSDRLLRAGAPVTSRLSPVWKTPAELALQKEFYHGYDLKSDSPVPANVWRIPEMGPALGAMGLAKKNDNGDWTTSADVAYAIDQNMPIIGRLRRQAPQEPKYRERAMTAWLSFLGIGSFTNSKSQQETTSFFEQQAKDAAAQRDKKLSQSPEERAQKQEIAQLMDKLGQIKPRARKSTKKKETPAQTIERLKREINAYQNP